MARELPGLRILVTGASSGIGRAVAEQAAAAGARVAAAARSADLLQQLASKGDVVSVPTDLAADADRRRLVETAVARLGGLDVLINIAGVASWGHFATSSEALLRQVMEVNFFAPAELIRLALPHLAKGRQPAIVNVSSMCGRRGVPAWPEYSASKFALVGLTESLRGELVRQQVNVLLVLPGLTRTNLPQHLLRNDGRADIRHNEGMLPEEVAAGVLRALRFNRTETVLGWEARWILRVNRFFPRLVDWLMARRVRQLYASK